MPTKAERQRAANAMSALGEQLSLLAQRKVRDVLPWIDIAKKQIKTDMTAWLALHPDGTERFTYRRLAEALRALSETEKILGTTIPGVLAKTMITAGADAGNLAVTHVIEQMGFAGFELGAVVPDLDRAVLLQRGGTLLIPRYDSSAARYGSAARRDLKRFFSIGALRGETFGEMTNRIVRHWAPLKSVVNQAGAIDTISTGLSNRYRYWAERLVRTEVIQSYNVVEQLSLKAANLEDPGYMKRWDAANDRRVCPICRALDGKIVALDKEFAPGIEHPPAHPQCRCAQTPWRKEWGDEKIPGDDTSRQAA